MDSGRIEAIFLAEPEIGGRKKVDEATARAGVGLEGDAYALRAEGRAHKDREKTMRELTVVGAEALDELAAETGIELDPWELRRNVVTRGIALNELVGRRFRIGEAECLAVELNEPCVALERYTQPGVLKGLVHRGGIRARILADGVLRVGDPVTLSR